ncbi:Transcriptional regulator, DeoR family [Nostocoides japonicum T1-X7]|uniref:Lactose phosphotransferase system repressor n=1 Tax=Nostocoides japonicum T1-X7 TaxID=1194083 RepID=A0A077LZS0_9MICO|nr:DeoR/GlpR family DNA-binding transcription regulator [Tetrasphaera japonica]CCH79498.1 Transcriptional regulator, DeoR family [Tetrasphaera japonica T1-X7]
MYAEERQQRILDEARRDGRVEVGSLADALGVAAETIRRDLSVLERRGTLRRVHGGAIPVERLEIEPTYATRVGRLGDVKRRIAARALEELPHEGTVLLDSGSTTQAIAELLPPDLDLTVVTNSVSAAATLATHPGVSLYVLGGRVRGRTGATVGVWLTDALASIGVDVAFIGTNGLSPKRGLTTPDQAEASAKVAMVRCARRVVCVTDATKFGDDHLHRFAALDDIDLVITDDSLDPEAATALSAAGTEVVRA